MDMADSKLTSEQSDFIEKLYIENIMSVFRIVRSVTYGNNRIDCESVVQDTFVIAIQKVEHLMNHSKPVGWIFKTARNKAMDELKRKTNTTEIPTSYESLDQYERAEILVCKNFDNWEDVLTKEEINLLNKYWDEGYSISEIADIISVKPGTLRMRMSRIYAKIKNKNNL